jgi:hypothetical protein
MNLFIDLWRAADDFKAQLSALGITYARWEPQPIADQIKLHGCTNVPDDLPNWLRRGQGA